MTTNVGYTLLILAQLLALAWWIALWWRRRWNPRLTFRFGYNLGRTEASREVRAILEAYAAKGATSAEIRDVFRLLDEVVEQKTADVHRGQVVRGWHKDVRDGVLTRHDGP